MQNWELTKDQKPLNRINPLIFVVLVYFSDGKIVEYDAGNDLQGEVFKPLQNIDPFTLYELPALSPDDCDLKMMAVE